MNVTAYKVASFEITDIPLSEYKALTRYFRDITVKKDKSEIEKGIHMSWEFIE